jgi:hypothetical protein
MSSGDPLHTVFQVTTLCDSSRLKVACLDFWGTLFLTLFNHVAQFLDSVLSAGNSVLVAQRSSSALKRFEWAGDQSGMLTSNLFQTNYCFDEDIHHAGNPDDPPMGVIRESELGSALNPICKKEVTQLAVVEAHQLIVVLADEQVKVLQLPSLQVVTTFEVILVISIRSISISQLFVYVGIEHGEMFAEIQGRQCIRSLSSIRLHFIRSANRPATRTFRQPTTIVLCIFGRRSELFRRRRTAADRHLGEEETSHLSGMSSF